MQHSVVLIIIDLNIIAYINFLILLSTFNNYWRLWLFNKVCILII